MTEAQAEGLITDEMRATIGKRGTPRTSEVDKTMVRLFARSVGHTDAVYYDEAAAKAAGYRSLPCPPGYLGTPIFKPSGMNEGNAAQMLRSLGPQPRRPLNRVLNGGTEIEYFGDICAGDTLTAESYTDDLVERKGSLGEMLITTNKTEYKNQDGKVVAIATGTSIRY